MDLTEWRKAREGEAFTLPSGLEVRLRRVQLLDLALTGSIPAPLVGLANKLLSSDSMTVTVESWSEYAPVIRSIAQACLAAPEGLEVGELPASDLLAVYNWANDVTVAVRPFRGERRGNVAA